MQLRMRSEFYEEHFILWDLSVQRLLAGRKRLSFAFFRQSRSLPPSE